MPPAVWMAWDAHTYGKRAWGTKDLKSLPYMPIAAGQRLVQASERQQGPVGLLGLLLVLHMYQRPARPERGTHAAGSLWKSQSEKRGRMQATH